MKVLQVSKFYPPVRGGIESVTHALTEGLVRRGVDVQVLCADAGATTRTERWPAGYTVVRCGTLGRVLSASLSPSMLLEARRLARQVDLIHVHMPDPMAALALWASQPTVRIAVHWHSDVIRQRLAMRLYAPLQRWLLQRADAILVTSHAYLAGSTALKPWAGKTTVIPLGVAPPALEEPALKAPSPGGRRIFALGRMTAYKGFDVLIRASTLLPADVKVIIAGAGPMLKQWRSLVTQLRLDDRVFLPGELQPGEVAAHMSAAQVFCLPSVTRAEAFGVVILEAMACGKPVVACNIPGSGVPWVNVHQQTGFNVPVRNPPALAEALTRLIDDPDLAQRMGREGRRRYEAEFTTACMVERTVALYQGLLAHS